MVNVADGGPVSVGEIDVNTLTVAIVITTQALIYRRPTMMQKVLLTRRLGKNKSQVEITHATAVIDGNGANIRHNILQHLNCGCKMCYISNTSNHFLLPSLSLYTT